MDVVNSTLKESALPPVLSSLPRGSQHQSFTERYAKLINSIEFHGIPNPIQRISHLVAIDMATDRTRTEAGEPFATVLRQRLSELQRGERGVCIIGGSRIRFEPGTEEDYQRFLTEMSRRFLTADGPISIAGGGGTGHAMETPGRLYLEQRMALRLTAEVSGKVIQVLSELEQASNPYVDLGYRVRGVKQFLGPRFQMMRTLAPHGVLAIPGNIGTMIETFTTLADEANALTPGESVKRSCPFIFLTHPQFKSYWHAFKEQRKAASEIQMPGLNSYEVEDAMFEVDFSHPHAAAEQVLNILNTPLYLALRNNGSSPPVERNV